LGTQTASFTGGKPFLNPELPAMLVWLVREGFAAHVAGRRFKGEPEASLRAGYARLFARLGVPIDTQHKVALALFPDLDAAADVPEITTACWGILGRSPEALMCASARMVAKRKGGGPGRDGLHAAARRRTLRAGAHAARVAAAGAAQTPPTAPASASSAAARAAIRAG
jgi:hypothetical protein